MKIARWALAILLLCGETTVSAQDPSTREKSAQPNEKLDFDRARDLLQKQNRGEKLSEDEATFLQQAQAAFRAGAGRRPADSRMIGGKDHVGFKPLNEMTAEERYLNQEGGLYGEGRNEPPKDHAAAAERTLKMIEPLDAAGQPALNGTIGFISISMSNATQEFSMFKQIADSDRAKSPWVTIVDCAQGGQAMAEWVDPQARPWEEASRRIAAAGLDARQIQIAWIKLANKGPHGTLEEHVSTLQRDTAAVIRNAKVKYPNLRFAFLSSRIYGGYSNGSLNPEPYAYEGAFAVRGLIREQISGDESLAYREDTSPAPLLLWGPYLWADGIHPRKADGLAYERSDLASDGTHPSQTGRKKVAQVMLEFFKNDRFAKSWFVK